MTDLLLLALLGLVLEDQNLLALTVLDKLNSDDSFDMETGAIASVCDKSGVPMLSLRKISDDADDASVEDYREMNNRQEACLTELLINILERILDDDSQWA